jgi:hypothetical protein
VEESMDISTDDKDRILKLVREGKTISKIVTDDLKNKYDYFDVYLTIKGDGEQGALGIKRMISTKLKTIIEAKKEERKVLIDEIGELVESLYKKSKANQKKLEDLRKVLDK